MTDHPDKTALTLGFDTSGPYVAAALLRGKALLGARAEEMKRGQSERLMGLLEELLAEHGAAWADLARIGVGIGPGNFTGIRISVSAARGLALALDIPAIGVSSFEAARYGAAPESTALVPAVRDQAYVSEAAGPVFLAPLADWEGRGLLPPAPAALAERVARIAAASRDTETPPAPLYIRPADAAPASDPPPVILDAPETSRA